MSGQTNIETRSALDDPAEIVDAILRGDPRWVADPYPLYARLRAQAPVHRSAEHGMLVVSTYEDVLAVQRHAGISHASYTSDVDPRFAASPALQRFASFLVFLDPPDHDRIRTVTRAAFTKRNLEAERAFVQHLVDSLLVDACDAGTFDYIGEFAGRISIGTTCHMLGVPECDRGLFVRWNELLLSAVYPGVPDELLAEADRATLLLEEYLRALLAERGSGPGEDVLSLVAAAQHDGLLSENEALGLLIMLFIAGTDTTANLIGNGTVALVEHPGELARLRADPSLLPNAIEEFLRYNSVVQMAFPRIATDAALRLRGGDVEVAAGDELMLLLAGANRDPEQFERPESLDVGRANANRHMGFGHGLHLCLGANLARLSAAAAFSGVLERCRQIEILDDPVPWFLEGNTRGLKRLSVSVEPA